ncbi:MAG: hypothetical protein SP1CHLAM54_11870 [Chlamydiia bacterium]|nr:hypothetical protein [Chlamydiia bacterium]MCH9616086.1 hypothetical protein [Chlamydiia bacterium]MCH9629491.1 hypothetical protein [Chlamydiia bacterium]
MQSIAVVCSDGLGDALLMMIASNHYKNEGAKVTTLTPHLSQLSNYFPGHHFAPFDTPLDDFDSIIVQNNNKPHVTSIIEQYRSKCRIFYPTYDHKRHALLSPSDAAFDPDLPMAENIAHAVQNGDLTNGITPPSHLTFQKHKKRILIHPTSANLNDCYLKSRYLAVASHLETMGYTVAFITSPSERPAFENCGFELPLFNTLRDLADYIFESRALIGNDSGPGHLASNLGLKTLIVANDEKRMRLWRPAWSPTLVITPKSWIPNMKGVRLRTKYWAQMIPKTQILRKLSFLTS